jgi:hypothetical protein
MLGKHGPRNPYAFGVGKLHQGMLGATENRLKKALNRYKQPLGKQLPKPIISALKIRSKRLLLAAITKRENMFKKVIAQLEREKQKATKPAEKRALDIAIQERQQEMQNFLKTHQKYRA